jgi:transcriptional regulator GlxA family with amidase domain/YHS domain-containing protein
MEIAIVIYPGFTALDAVGPFEVLSRLPGAKASFVAQEEGPVQTDWPGGAVVARPFAGLQNPDIVVVAGGSTTQQHLGDDHLLAWLRRAHATSTWTTSVCTGALLLGAAGLLEGRRATTHWYELESLAVFGAIPVAERVVEDGKIVTAAGISAGIDMALRLSDRIAGPDHTQWVTLNMEYDPDPPYQTGSLSKASAELAARARGYMASGYGPTWAQRSVARADVTQNQPIDPVCGMSPDPIAARAAALVCTYGAVDYYFCSRGCMLDFEKDPTQFRDPS